MSVMQNSVSLLLFPLHAPESFGVLTHSLTHCTLAPRLPPVDAVQFNMILRQKRALYDISMELYGPGVDRLWYECGAKLRSRTMEKYYRGWTVYQNALEIADRIETQLRVVRKLRGLSDGAWECIASLICPAPEESADGGGAAGGGGDDDDDAAVGSSRGSGESLWKSYRYGSVGALLDSELMQRSMDGLLDEVESSVQHWMELD